MKKLFYYMALTLAMAVCMTDFTSCSDDDDQPQIATFSLDMASLDPQYVDQENNCITITEGESAEMIFVVEPAEFAKQIVLTSADESICAVDGLKLVAKKAGTVKITATAGGKSVSFDVVVNKTPIDLSKLTGDYVTQDGDVLTGTLNGETQPYKISIADSATITLKDLTINGVNSRSYQWAGITCEGDATIVLKGDNTVKAFYEDYPGIFAAEKKTLTIKGTGSLAASSDFAAGIGCGLRMYCGNIVIEGGIITATGGRKSAGIGSCNRAACGNITISGGTITATGGELSAGIGCGYNGWLDGTITITDGVTKVTATKGKDAPYSIGESYSGNFFTMTIIIGGVEYPNSISESPFTYEPGKK